MCGPFLLIGPLLLLLRTHCCSCISCGFCVQPDLAIELAVLDEPEPPHLLDMSAGHANSPAAIFRTILPALAWPAGLGLECCMPDLGLHIHRCCSPDTQHLAHGEGSTKVLTMLVTAVQKECPSMITCLLACTRTTRRCIAIAGFQFSGSPLLTLPVNGCVPVL